MADVADLVREQVAPRGSRPLDRCLVLDTGNAQEGFLLSRRTPVPQSEIGSTKKRVRPGDVRSRLRPYLRQVAYVDEALANGEIVLLCSTEFFVLRSHDDRCIAFLVPFLLSEPVQQVLALSQEGGHHPRFSETTLRSLPLPTGIDAIRDEVSAAVVAAVERVGGPTGRSRR